MENKKITLKQYRLNIRLTLLVGILLGLMSGITLMLNTMNLDPDVDIPSGDDVSFFCKHYRDYDGGFLAGECGANKVKCYKNIDKSSFLDTDYTAKYECVWWASMEHKNETARGTA